MFDKFLKRLRPEKAAGDFVRPFPSPHGDRPNISPDPLLIYGHNAEGTAKTISEYSTVSCLAVAGLNNLTGVLDGRPLAGLLAMSPRGASGEAGIAIAMFHSSYPQHMALYAPWSYNVERSAKWAIKYGAEGVVMPGIVVGDMMNYIIRIGQRTGNGETAPTDVEEHERLLRECTPNSPFWRLQDRPDGPDY